MANGLESPVPVTMGSPRFHIWNGAVADVTHAWFPPDAVLHAHVHDRPTFAVILSGGFDLAFTSPAIRRNQLTCQPGTLFVEPAGERHANRCSRDGARVIVVQPDVFGHSLPAPCERFLDRVHHFRDGPLAASAGRLAREIVSPDVTTPIGVESIVCDMLAEAARLDGARVRPRDPPAWMARTVDCLHDRFRDQGLRLADIAAVAGVHVAHLAHTFRRVHRVSVGSYLRRLRVEWVAERLTASVDPVSIVAADAGFADQAHLTRWFKRVTGTTPAAYRTARSRPAAFPT